MLTIFKLMENSYAYYIGNLKKKIREISGLSMLNYSDSILLSQKFEERGISLSTHTIARFFGLLEERKLYPSTLDLFCNYVGSENFHEFINQTSQEDKRSLLNNQSLFESKLHNFHTYQLNMEMCNLPGLHEHLENINFKSEFIDNLAHLTGFLIRKSPFQNELLDFLSSNEQGRRLFYERFVDEDDPQEYFSRALQQNYSKHIQNYNNHIFLNAYLLANRIYRNSKIKSVWLENLKESQKYVSKEELYFHEYSRILEVSILLDHTEKNILKVLDQALEYCEKLGFYEQAWVLARCLRACAKVNQMQVFKYENLKIKIQKLMPDLNIDSIGELILQLFYFKYFSTNENFRPPLTIQNSHYENEYKTRFSVEIATRSVLSGYDENSLSLLKQFSRDSGTDWVINVLSN